MITKLPLKPRLRLSLDGVLAYSLFGIAIAALLWVIVVLPGKAGYERALCDEAVKALYSDQLIDVTRAGIIIHRLRCDIR
jgi:hypothetical protein